jgi:hypothetical protein
MKKILSCTLQKKWFDLILAGKKKKEYREIKPFWISRLVDGENYIHYDEVHFRNGYGPMAPFMRVEFKGCRIDCKKNLFVIRLGRVIEHRP